STSRLSTCRRTGHTRRTARSTSLSRCSRSLTSRLTTRRAARKSQSGPWSYSHRVESTSVLAPRRFSDRPVSPHEDLVTAAGPAGVVAAATLGEEFTFERLGILPRWLREVVRPGSPTWSRRVRRRTLGRKRRSDRLLEMPHSLTDRDALNLLFPDVA